MTRVKPGEKSKLLKLSIAIVGYSKAIIFNKTFGVFNARKPIKIIGQFKAVGGRTSNGNLTSIREN